MAAEATAVDFGGDFSGDQASSWEGSTGEGVAADQAAIEASRERLRAAYREAARLIAVVNQHGEQSGRDLAAVEEDWRRDKEFLNGNAGDAGVPEVWAGFLQAAQRRVDAAAGIVEQTAALYQQAAQQIRSTAGDLPAGGGT